MEQRESCLVIILKIRIKDRQILLPVVEISGFVSTVGNPYVYTLNMSDAKKNDTHTRHKGGQAQSNCLILLIGIYMTRSFPVKRQLAFFFAPDSDYVLFVLCTRRAEPVRL